MQKPFVQRLIDVVFSTDPKQRLRITRSLMATNVYILYLLLQVYAWWAGFMSASDVVLLTSAVLAYIAVCYATLRSGLNLRFKEPALTLPQVLTSITLIVGGYSLTGPVHGAMLMLLALVLVFGIFNLKALPFKIVSVYTVVLMGIAMAIKVNTDPLQYPLKLEIAHFILMAAIVPTIAMLAVQFSSMRHKLQMQKNELAQAVNRIQLLATRDELTGLPNRRHMREVLTEHQQRLDRSGHHRFCLALLDLDFFKRVNDTYGHGVGDEVLRHFAKEARSVMRDVDVMARWGGEEFLLLLVDTSPELAQIGIARIRDKLSTSPVAAGDTQLYVKFSAGLTGYWGTEALDTSIERADKALYAAKDQGRNCTVIEWGPGAELEATLVDGQLPMKSTSVSAS
jgi:diguanylate cyclase (GGDEF)-like protein